jgi:7-cyano-7-deazaguanine synthase in queuosine biosynthesis
MTKPAVVLLSGGLDSATASAVAPQELGVDLGVDYSLTVSCYDPDEAGAACGHCDSCLLRRKGFDTPASPTRPATR